MPNELEIELRSLCARLGWRADGDGKTLIKRIENQVRSMKAALTTSHRVGQIELDRPPTCFPALPIMTKEQEAAAEEGACPTCRIKSLSLLGIGEGMRFYGCMKCKGITILTYRGGPKPD